MQRERQSSAESFSKLNFLSLLRLSRFKSHKVDQQGLYAPQDRFMMFSHRNCGSRSSYRGNGSCCDISRCLRDVILLLLHNKHKKTHFPGIVFKMTLVLFLLLKYFAKITTIKTGLSCFLSVTSFCQGGSMEVWHSMLYMSKRTVKLEKPVYAGVKIWILPCRFFY